MYTHLLEQNRDVIRSICRLRRHEFNDNTNLDYGIEQNWVSQPIYYSKRREIIKEFNRYYKYYLCIIDKNRLPWPTCVFEKAAEYFMLIPRYTKNLSRCTKDRKSLLAVCLKQACLEGVEFSPTEKELCELMQISETELADGIHSVNNLKAKGQINFMSIDFIRCEISTMFARLYLHHENQLKECVYDFIQKTSRIRSNIRIKVVGATCATLWVTYRHIPRCFTLEQLCSIRDVSKQAVKTFLKQAATLYPPV